jgi:propanediol dehydratase large subunit
MSLGRVAVESALVDISYCTTVRIVLLKTGIIPAKIIAKVSRARLVF